MGAHSSQGSTGRTFSSSSTTSMCTRPRTDSPLMCVMRSPARSPASCAGLPSSTLCGGGGRTQQGHRSRSRTAGHTPTSPCVTQGSHCISFPAVERGRTNWGWRAPWFPQPGPTVRGLSRTHPDHMVYRVHVTVTHVDANGAQAEAILLA